MTSTTTRRELPALFKPEMVQALLNTQLDTWPPEPIDPAKAYKGMTRRIMSPQPSEGFTASVCEEYEPVWIDKNGEEQIGKSRYGCYDIYGHNEGYTPKYQPGDLIYVRESWAQAENVIWFKATDSSVAKSSPQFAGWKPSIHMPKAAARIWLECVDVKVERVQDISEEDIMNEGVRIRVGQDGGTLWVLGEDNSATSFLPAGCWADGAPPLSVYQMLWAHWAELWCKINGRQKWNANPWVWVYSFKVISKTGRP